jgi:hypothetical protein
VAKRIFGHETRNDLSHFLRRSATADLTEPALCERFGEGRFESLAACHRHDSGIQMCVANVGCDFTATLWSLLPLLIAVTQAFPGSKLARARVCRVAIEG